MNPCNITQSLFFIFKVMDSPCSVTRRQAWAQCSRQWLTVEDTELQTSDTQNSLAPQPQHESYKNNNLQSSKKGKLSVFIGIFLHWY